MEPELKNRLFPFHQVKGEESLVPQGRLLIIGDVHGCVRELEKLLKTLNPQKEDQILFLGDLINRGPDSKTVLSMARTLNASSLLGNHEYRLLKHIHQPGSIILRSYEANLLDNLDSDDWNYLSSMVLWFEQPNEKRLFVHGGFLPKVPWHQQSAEIVTHIQTIDKQGIPRRRGEIPDAVFWTDLWDQEPFVIYGHTPRQKVVKTKTTIGIDTGCVWGGHLTALILPEFEIVQVKSKKNYIK